jgi:hypothetical protein
MVAAVITPLGLIVIVGLLSRWFGSNLRNNRQNRRCKLLAELTHGLGSISRITTGLILIYLLLFGQGHFGVLRLWVKPLSNMSTFVNFFLGREFIWVLGLGRVTAAPLMPVLARVTAPTTSNSAPTSRAVVNGEDGTARRWASSLGGHLEVNVNLHHLGKGAVVFLVQERDSQCHVRSGESSALQRAWQCQNLRVRRANCAACNGLGSICQSSNCKCLHCRSVPQAS